MKKNRGAQSENKNLFWHFNVSRLANCQMFANQGAVEIHNQSPKYKTILFAVKICLLHLLTGCLAQIFLSQSGKAGNPLISKVLIGCSCKHTSIC
jgi:hypothetical protein